MTLCSSCRLIQAHKRTTPSPNTRRKSYNGRPARLHHSPRRNRMVPKRPTHWNYGTSADRKRREAHPRNGQSTRGRRPIDRPLESSAHVTSESPLSPFPLFSIPVQCAKKREKTNDLGGISPPQKLRLSPPPRPAHPRTPQSRLQRSIPLDLTVGRHAHAHGHTRHPHERIHPSDPLDPRMGLRRPRGPYISSSPAIARGSRARW